MQFYKDVICEIRCTIWCTKEAVERTTVTNPGRTSVTGMIVTTAKMSVEELLLHFFLLALTRGLCRLHDFLGDLLWHDIVV